MGTLTIKELRQKKLLFALPIIALPFVTFIFWKLGGGTPDETAPTDLKQGFNLELPDAKLDDKAVDKMSYYTRANADSLKLAEAMRNDPSYNDAQSPIHEPGMYGNNLSLYGSQRTTNATADQISLSLERINRSMEEERFSANVRPSGRSVDSYSGNSPQAERLQAMMHGLGQSETDPELDQLSAMLDKLNDLQNPEVAKEKARQANNAKRGRVYNVSSKAKENIVTTLGSGADKSTSTGFFGGGIENLEEYQNAVQAVIHENQTVVNGTTVKMRLLNDIVVDGRKISKDNFIYGEATLQGERLKIEIKSIRIDRSLYPVQLTVFDLDGIDGIRIPDAISRKVAKDGINQGVQSIGLGSLDPSFGTQAAGIGVEVVKNFIGKNTKLIRVTLKAGYRLLLRDEQQKNDPVDLIQF